MNTYEVIIKYTHGANNHIYGAAIDRLEEESAIKAFNHVINAVTNKVGSKLNIYEVHIEEK